MVAKKIVFTLFSILTLLFISQTAFAEQVGKISLIEGTVDILIKGKSDAEPARINMPVGAGDIIRTKSNSKAEIKFADDSIIRLAEKSRIEIKEYMFEKDIGRRKGTINLLRGKMRSLIGKAVDRQHDYNVITRTAVAGVRGTDFFVISQPLSTQVIVKEGIVAVRNISPQIIGEVLVKVNQMTNVVQNAPPPPPVAVPVEVMKGLTAETELSKPESKKMEDREKPPERAEPSGQPPKEGKEKVEEKAPERREPSGEIGQKPPDDKRTELDKKGAPPDSLQKGQAGVKDAAPQEIAKGQPTGTVGAPPPVGAVAPPPGVIGAPLPGTIGVYPPPPGVTGIFPPPPGTIGAPLPGMIGAYPLPSGVTGVFPPPPGTIGAPLPVTIGTYPLPPGTIGTYPGTIGANLPPPNIPITEVNPALLRPKVKIKVEF